MGIELSGRNYDTDEEGYLANLSDWSPEIAGEMAKLDDCDLGEHHWEVINFLRNYYEEYQIAPAVRVLTRSIGRTLGKDKGNSKYLYQLFLMGRPNRPVNMPDCQSQQAASSQFPAPPCA